MTKTQSTNNFFWGEEGLNLALYLLGRHSPTLNHAASPTHNFLFHLFIYYFCLAELRTLCLISWHSYHVNHTFISSLSSFPPNTQTILMLWKYFSPWLFSENILLCPLGLFCSHFKNYWDIESICKRSGSKYFIFLWARRSIQTIQFYHYKKRTMRRHKQMGMPI
jgi:hypothetical protein